MVLRVSQVLETANIANIVGKVSDKPSLTMSKGGDHHEPAPRHLDLRDGHLKKMSSSGQSKDGKVNWRHWRHAATTYHVASHQGISSACAWCLPVMRQLQSRTSQLQPGRRESGSCYHHGCHHDQKHHPSSSQFYLSIYIYIL